LIAEQIGRPTPADSVDRDELVARVHGGR